MFMFKRIALAIVFYEHISSLTIHLEYMYICISNVVSMQVLAFIKKLCLRLAHIVC